MSSINPEDPDQRRVVISHTGFPDPTHRSLVSWPKKIPFPTSQRTSSPSRATAYSLLYHHHLIVLRQPARILRRPRNHLTKFCRVVSENAHDHTIFLIHTMKVFSSDCTFDYTWAEVSTANWRKYCPWNDKSTHVIAVDTLSRSVDPSTGIVCPSSPDPPQPHNPLTTLTSSTPNAS